MTKAVVSQMVYYYSNRQRLLEQHWYNATTSGFLDGTQSVQTSADVRQSALTSAMRTSLYYIRQR